MQAKLPTLSAGFPKRRFEVAAVPDYLEKTSASAYYEPGTPDGSRPGRLRINTWNAPDRNLFEVESTAYHEGLPGHHMQISISQEQTGVPEFRKYGFYTAFIEGWALYAERLGKDLGLYQDPYSDYGRLENDQERAIRLVVDTGVHAGHWTRQQMVDFFHDHSSIDGARGAGRGGPLHRMAQPGAGVQDRPVEDPGTARPREESPGRQVRHPRVPRPGDRCGRAAAGRAGGAHRYAWIASQKS